MTEITMHGETWDYTAHAHGSTYRCEGNGMYVTVNITDTGKYSYVVSDIDTDSAQTTFHSESVLYNTSTIPSVILACALEAMIECENEYMEDCEDNYYTVTAYDDGDDYYESDGYAMIGGDSDLWDEF